MEDPETLVQCPYDKSHRVRVARLPYHLVKCERNNPHVARQLATCPFNACHRVPHAELRRHIASCPYRHRLDAPPEVSVELSVKTKSPEPPTAWQSPPCQEDWEAELDELEDAPPFILTIETGKLLLPNTALPQQHPGATTEAQCPPKERS